jgi:hypothetical protein
VPARSGPRRLDIVGVLAESRRLYVAGFGVLLALGLAVFVPLGFVEALSLNVSDVEGLHGSTVVVIVLITFLVVSVALVGEVLYSGMVTRAVADERRGEAHGIGEVVRTLPYGRLIVADILYVLLVVVGLVLLVAPGLLALVWFALVAPVIEVERLGLVDAFRRSRRLIRQDFRRAAVLVAGVAIASELLGQWIQVAASGAFGDSWVAEWAGATLSGLVTGPLFALPIVVLYFELAERAGPDPAPAAAATSSGTVTKR